MLSSPRFGFIERAKIGLFKPPARISPRFADIERAKLRLYEANMQISPISVNDEIIMVEYICVLCRL